jgi:N-dimethylarginine dimethylaminohydrolase
VIIGAEHKRLIREIEKHGVLAVAVPFDKPSELGGGIRCSTHPLLREP